MKLISMAKTVRQVRDGLPVTDGGGLPAGDDAGWLVKGLAGWRHLPSPSSAFDIRDGRLYKDVTRRGGWTKKKGEPAVWRRGWAKAKAGDLVELVEWSPRVGARWSCDLCGSLGPTGAAILPDRVLFGPSEAWAYAHTCGIHGPHGLEYRYPERLGVRRIVSADAVQLGNIDQVDLVREGFPGMTPEAFVAMYCAPKPPHPAGIVTRLVLAREVEA